MTDKVNNARYICPQVKVFMVSTKTQILNTSLDGKITAEKSSLTLDVTGNAQTITAAGTTYECLLVPSDAISTRQDLDLTLTIDGEDKTATLSGDNGVIIAQNTKSNITITLSNKGISIQTVSVEDWNVVEVGGHKVTVKFADNVTPYDILTEAHVEGNNVIIKASSFQSKRLICNVGGDAQCESVVTNDKFTFTISEISSDIEAVLGYPPVVTLTVTSDSSGKVWIGDDKNKTSGQYEFGEQVVIHAAPNDKFRLYRWNDNNRENSRTITIGATDVTYSASFIPQDMIPGLFTVDLNGKQVFFSKGNLYCSGVKFTVNGYSGWGLLTGGDNGEWSYLLSSRNTAYGSNRRYAAVKVNGMAGLLIFPDDFSSWPSGVCDEPQTFNTNSNNWNERDYTVDQFNTLQNNGCVFLPAAGHRDGKNGEANVVLVGNTGNYWSASPNVAILVFDLSFISDAVNPSDSDARHWAQSVRLVTECQRIFENPLQFFDGTIIVTIFAIKMSARCIQKLIKLAFEIMAQATMTVRTDSKVKTEFTNLCEQFGMSANTAMNIFMRAVMESRSIPFTIGVGTKDNANERLRTMLALNAERRRNSNEPEISLDEINAEIAAYRAEKK